MDAGAESVGRRGAVFVLQAKAISVGGREAVHAGMQGEKVLTLQL